MGQLVITDFGMETILGGEMDFTGIYIFLFQNDWTPDFDSEWDDVEECDFSGYGAFNTLFNMEDPDPPWFIHEFNGHRFQHDGGGTANTVYGWGLYWLNGGNEMLLCAKRFDETPMSFALAGDHIDITGRNRLKRAD